MASKCEPGYGGMGRTGFRYDSAKDQLRWRHLSVRNHVNLIMRIGEVMALKDEDYEKQRVEKVDLKGKDLENMLFSLF